MASVEETVPRMTSISGTSAGTDGIHSSNIACRWSVAAELCFPWPVTKFHQQQSYPGATGSLNVLVTF